ncbi:MAG: hypothetical protein GX589_07170 [Deltaproteobacteria bacterium]|nr:hypothetical protein [Deltaproteobacteria bacterium]
MSEDMKIRQTAIEGLDPALTSLPEAKKKKANEIGKDEFLTMLVAQLKHQDPMDPMKNEDFAVNLAQFSQLEQLIAINNKIESQSAAEGGFLASYLGQEIVLDSSTIQVKNGDGGKVAFDLGADAKSVSIDLVDAEGTVRETVNLGAMKAGRQTVSLSELHTQGGEFKVKINALSTGGLALNPQGFAAGIVNGFVPGIEPMLLMDGREVSPGEIKEVRVPSKED